MFAFGNVFIYLLLLVLCGPSVPFVTEDLMLELYSKYISAVSNDNFTSSTRRLFKRNREYEIHIKKLKEVNGYKKHNLLVKEHLRNGGREYIYINNPVESKTPKAYLTLEEFKNALTDRVLAQKKEFTFQRTTKNLQQQTYNKKPKTTRFHKIILRQNIIKDRQQETTSTTKRERITNIIEKVSNIDIIKYDKTVNKYISKINKNKEKTTVMAKTDSAENNAHENNVTTEKIAKNNVTTEKIAKNNVTTEKIAKNNVTTEKIAKNNVTTEKIAKNNVTTEKIAKNNVTTEKIAKNNVILHLVSNIEAYKNKETEISVQSQDLDTTEPIPENTKIEEPISHSLTSNFEESELTDTTTVLENTVELRTERSEILNITEVTTESFKVKEKPRRKKTTKLYSISYEKRRSTLGRPLVFFGSR